VIAQACRVAPALASRSSQSFGISGRVHPALQRLRTPTVASRLDMIDTLVPHRRAISALTLGALENLILSRIDGRRNVTDLAVLVGLTARETLHVLSRLEELRLVNVVRLGANDEIELDVTDLEEYACDEYVCDRPTSPAVKASIG
jgi:hypothetical protein